MHSICNKNHTSSAGRKSHHDCRELYIWIFLGRVPIKKLWRWRDDDSGGSGGRRRGFGCTVFLSCSHLCSLELQPGPWSARAQVYSVPDPLAPFGRKFHVGIIDNVAITMPPQKTIPLPPMRSLPSLELLLQLELASLQRMEGAEEENGGGRRKGGLSGAPCYLHRGALYSDPVRLDCRVWHDRALKKPPRKSSTLPCFCA